MVLVLGDWDMNEYWSANVVSNNESVLFTYHLPFCFFVYYSFLKRAGELSLTLSDKA